ncbi:hypothetical protein [uncultured Pseudoalteromonas sp.]|uniref:ATP-grasp domain-containing protein n=1 Tax=uncultured Pseudoalteromonas sp. TaxID=114053 RepID=UPI00259AD223|nr:hypothetical protein [uncultured Pseudoalteromonas sp.]
MKLAICSYLQDGKESISSACEKLNIDYEIIDLLDNNWLEHFQSSDYDGVMIRPPCTLEAHKQIYDERSYILNKKLSLPIYPSYEELTVYESKRNMHSWAQLYNLPHPKTNVFTSKKQAYNFFKYCSYPFVSKSNVGASGISVKIIKTEREAKRLARKIFGALDPELAIGYCPIGKKKNIPYPRFGRRQIHYMICQEFIDIKWEWRVIRLHNSYFGHKKLIGKNNMASGSLLVGWEAPPKELLNLVKEFSENAEFTSVALDIFESRNGEFFVNEVQTIIGAIAPSQMYINNKPGRYIYENDDFRFEEGEFCKNQCWDLRLEAFLSQLKLEVN